MTSKITSNVANSAFYGLSLAMQNERKTKGIWERENATEISPHHAPRNPRRRNHVAQTFLSVQLNRATPRHV
jgi:hypothetical protein